MIGSVAFPACAAAGNRPCPLAAIRGESHPDDPIVESTMRPKNTRLTGDAETRFRAMVDEQFDFIWRSLRGFGLDSASVDDAAQQVFLIASQKFDAIAAGSERAFLYAIARGIAANTRRSASRRRELSDDEALASQTDERPNPEQIVASRRDRELLDRLLAGLPEDVRPVFILYELEGMTMSEIAELLALPPGTVASRLRRAREDFHTAARRYQAESK